MRIVISDANGALLGELQSKSSSRIGRPFGSGYRAADSALTRDIEWLRSVGEFQKVDAFVAALRDVAECYESELAALSDDLDSGSEVSEGHSELFEGSVSELDHLAVVHDSPRSVGAARRALRVLRRGARLLLNRHGDSSTRGRPDIARGPNVEGSGRGGHGAGLRVDAAEDGAA